MKDVVKLEKGRAPWEPSSDVGLGEVLDRYDIPLAGILHEGGRTILYANILGDSDDVGVWAYSWLEEAELKSLLSATDPESFDPTVDRALSNRPVTVAASFDYKLSLWTTLDSGIEGPLVLVDRFLSFLNDTSKDAKRGKEEVDRMKDLMPA